MVDTFKAYTRDRGRPGVRNHVLIIPTVVCSSKIAVDIARRVKGATALPHEHGCTQVGADFDQTRRTLIGAGTNPNVGGAIVVGLGCENVGAESIASVIGDAGVPVELILVQECGGSTNALERGVDMARKMRRKAARARREEHPVSELVLATECGGSDATSGLVSNPVIGVVADMVVGMGGTVVLSETTEFIGAEGLLVERACTKAVGDRILGMVRKVEDGARLMGVDLRGSQPTPGNIQGGITTIEEKSLGCIYKGGSSRINAALDYAERIGENRGLVVMDTPGQDVESMTGMFAGGAHLALFSTGRGTPTGSAIGPVIKVSASPYACAHMRENIDFAIESLPRSSREIEEIGHRLFELMLRTASGELTRSEILGHAEFGINRIGPSF